MARFLHRLGQTAGGRQAEHSKKEACSHSYERTLIAALIVLSVHVLAAGEGAAAVCAGGQAGAAGMAATDAVRDEVRPGGVLCCKTGLDTDENARRVCRMNVADKSLPNNAIRNTK